MRLRRRQLKFFARLVWGTAIFAVILFAACVQLGRSIFPYLNNYSAQIEAILSAQLNATIKVGHVQGRWQGLRPALMLNDVSVSGGTPGIDTGELYAKHVSVEVNLLALVFDWRVALGQLQFEGLRAQLTQAQDGLWSVAGLPKTSAENRHFKLDDPLDIFLLGRRLALKDTELSLGFNTGHVAEMTIPSVTLENDANFHRLKAKIGVDADTEAFYWVLEGIGDPRNAAAFSAKGYLRLNQFPLQKVVAATGLQKWLNIEPGRWSKGSRMNMQLWFDGSMHKGMSFSGWAKADGLPFDLPSNIEAPSIPKFSYTGHWNRAEGLFAQLKQLGLSWPQASAPPLDIELAVNATKGVAARIRELNVTAWGQAFEALNISGPASGIYASLKPRGLLSNIGITLTTPDEGYFKLQADVVEGAVDSWQGAPEIRHASGFVELSAKQGRMVIASNEGFVMHYPKMYKKPLSFDEAAGEVAWFLDLPQKMVYVTSGLLYVKGESGEGSGYVYLSIPTHHSDEIEPEMMLIVGMRNSVAKYHDMFIPYTIPDSFYQWLNNSIKEGNLSDGAFIYRGSLLAQPLRPRSLQLGLNIEQGKLAFDPHWPVLENVDATLLLDDFDLNIAIARGQLQGNVLHKGQVSLTRTSNNKPALLISADVHGDTQNVLALLRNSPINTLAGDALSQMQATGPYQGHVNLRVPLGGNLADGWQDIQASVSDGTFALASVGLEFKQIKADVAYHSSKGLSVPQLSALLWNKPISGHLKTQKNQKGRWLALDFAVPEVAISDVNSWLKQPFLDYLEGRTAVAGQVKLPFDHPEQGIDLRLTSSLAGVAINLPEPYAKSAEQPIALSMSYRLPRGSNNSQIGIVSQLQNSTAAAAMTLAGSQLVALDVGLNEAAVAVDGSMHVHGHFEQLDAKAWWHKIDDYRAKSNTEHVDSKASITDNALSDTALEPSVKKAPPVSLAPLFSMAISADTARFGDLELQSVKASARQLPEAFYFDIDTPMVLASYLRFDDKRPSDVTIKYLHLRAPSTAPVASATLASEAVQQQKTSLLADAALEHLEAMNVSISQLTLGDEALGHVSFSYRPQLHGLVAKDIAGQLRGVTTQNGTLAIYKRGPSEWESSFSGPLSVANVGDVLRRFGLPAAITSQTATATLSLNWPGYPDQMAMDKLSGSVDLSLDSGLFTQGESGGESALLQLFALFNFDTIARRLRLDFSDLNTEGLAYDTVRGRFMFDRDRVRLPEESPLVVDTSSADLFLTGELSMSKKTINSQLVATLPAAGNLAVAAAFVAGLPAAMGVYVVGKLFKKQVDDLASVRYNVTGPWADPKVQVAIISREPMRPSAKKGVEGVKNGVKKGTKTDAKKTD
ncbi:MAG: DUF3971 domain-containing protein [Marinagarivorans sp.]|nr:DUF3971 domain-containing protein [Marinagarivorans sp.]